MSEDNAQTSKFALYPLAWLAAAFICGILPGKFSAVSWQVYLTVCLIFAGFAMVFINKKSAAIFLVISFTSLGALCFQIEKQSVAPDRLKIFYDEKVFSSGDAIEITGVVQGKPELAVGGFFLELKTESAIYKGAERSVSGNVRLFAAVINEQIADEYEQLQLKHGARIRVACELRRENRFLNPGVVLQKEILDRQNFDATAVIKSPLLIENLSSGETFTPLAQIFESRQNLILEFKKRFSVPAAGVLIASLLGNRYHLDKPTAEKFREGGTFHVVVISGLQITFIGGLAVWLMRRFTKNRWAQFLSATAFLWIYTLAVGADVPVVRAALMFTVLHFAAAIFRESKLLNALGASALILLVWRPADAFDQSFQLTFACVGAIVAAAFPLLERIKAIGAWQPNAETPVPPACSKTLKTFCETLYWSERDWQREQSRSVWQAKLFKTPYAGKLEEWKLQKVLRYVFEVLLVSIVVQAWLVPLLIIYFHRLSLISIFLNVWVGILMAIESVFALFAVFAAQISEIFAAPFVLLTEILNWILLHAADPFIESGWASIRLPHYAGALGVVYVLYFLPILVLTVALHKWKPFRLTEDTKRKMENEEKYFKFFVSQFLSNKFSLAVYAVLLGIIVFHPFSAPVSDGRLHIDFLDVGQGDSALVTMPTGETLLVDGGGRPNFNNLYVKREDEEPELFEPDAQSIGESVVSPFLWQKGLDKVDYILATHADADHIQGLGDVARNFDVNAAIVGRTPVKSAEFADFYDSLQRRDIPLLILARGQTVNFGDVKIEILHPARDATPEAKSGNNHSIVLRVGYGARKFLLTGDIEKETENELLNAPEFLQADVVKVAHHGSRTSSTQDFVGATKSKLAVISVGRESPFGHPKPEIVERWRNAGAKILTTGENGTISVSSDGRDLQLKTFGGKPVFR